jgi:hypothetical protein
MVFAAFHVGKIAGTVPGGWWLAAQDATRVAARARRLAGISPDLATAIAAVQRSATALGATLTPDDVAIRRAGDSMKRLDAMVETMRRDGTLRVFNARYQAGRAAAAAEGKGFMSFGVARARFKKALRGVNERPRTVCSILLSNSRKLGGTGRYDAVLWDQKTPNNRDFLGRRVTSELQNRGSIALETRQQIQAELSPPN